MDLKIVVIIAFSYLYGFFEMIMNLRQARQAKRLQPADRGSLWRLYALITLGYCTSFAVGATRYGRIGGWNTWFAIGFSLVFIGLVIRISSIRTLKDRFTYSVSRVDGHTLVQTGLYRVIRHPGYLGQILIFIGIALSLSNWLSVLSMAFFIAWGYGYRIRVEEKFMVEQFGQTYLDYQKRTRKLIPMIY